MYLRNFTFKSEKCQVDNCPYSHHVGQDGKPDPTAAAEQAPPEPKCPLTPKQLPARSGSGYVNINGYHVMADGSVEAPGTKHEFA